MRVCSLWYEGHPTADDGGRPRGDDGRQVSRLWCKTSNGGSHIHSSCHEAKDLRSECVHLDNSPVPLHSWRHQGWCWASSYRFSRFVKVDCARRCQAELGIWTWDVRENRRRQGSFRRL